VRVVIALSIALLVSLAGNAAMIVEKIRAAGEATAAGALANVTGKAEALAETLDRAKAVADQAAKDQPALIAELRGVADRSRKRITVYRDRVKTIPAAACPPGPERMDAVNESLRGAP